MTHAELLKQFDALAKEVRQAITKQVSFPCGRNVERIDRADRALRKFVEEHLAVTLSDDKIIDIANETHRAMPVDADEQAEMLAIVNNCFSVARGGEL